jgi:hypothetical protein
MGTLIDSTLWVDYFRPRTPLRVKQLIVPFVDAMDAALCEPVRFEILSAAFRRERRQIEDTFLTLPLLPSPPNLWEAATLLGQQCIDRGAQPRSLDLLIAVICLHHDAELVTFDAHFSQIAKVCPLKVHLLRRAT